MKTKKMHDKVYLSLVSVFLMAAPAVAFADEPDCVSLIGKAAGQNAAAIDEDAAGHTTTAMVLNSSTASTLAVDATDECKDLPNGGVVVSLLHTAIDEVINAADANVASDAISALVHETNVELLLTEADTDALVGVP